VHAGGDDRQPPCRLKSILLLPLSICWHTQELVCSRKTLLFVKIKI